MTKPTPSWRRTLQNRAARRYAAAALAKGAFRAAAMHAACADDEALCLSVAEGALKGGDVVVADDCYDRVEKRRKSKVALDAAVIVPLLEKPLKSKEESALFAAARMLGRAGANDRLRALAAAQFKKKQYPLAIAAAEAVPDEDLLISWFDQLAPSNAWMAGRFLRNAIGPKVRARSLAFGQSLMAEGSGRRTGRDRRDVRLAYDFFISSGDRPAILRYAEQCFGIRTHQSAASWCASHAVLHADLADEQIGVWARRFYDRGEQLEALRLWANCSVVPPEEVLDAIEEAVLADPESFGTVSPGPAMFIIRYREYLRLKAELPEPLPPFSRSPLFYDMVGDDKAK